MQAVFLPCLPDALQPLAARTQLSLCIDAPSLNRWLEPEQLRAVLGLYAHQWPQADSRAVASQWHQELSALVLPPLLLARLLSGSTTSVDPQQLGIKMDEHGTPLGLYLPEQADALHEDASGVRLLEEMYELLLLPLISRFAAHTGLAPRLLWGNVALCIDWVLDVAQACQPNRALGEALAWLREPCGARCSPLRSALRRNDTGVTRRVCCLRERLPLQRCAVCPLA